LHFGFLWSFAAKARKEICRGKMKKEVSGITLPEIFVGIHGTATAMHQEDNDFGSLNYCIDVKGQGKLW